MSAVDHPGVDTALHPRVGGILVVDEFLPAETAVAMRNDIDAHFREPYKHRAESHQVWNYWYVPQTYTYLRTQPEKVIERTKVERFLAQLRAWSIDTLGLGRISWPYLSFYVDGCRQGLHNDTRNGRYAFVYSLTRNERRTSGGETLVMRSGDPFLRRLRQPSAGADFYEMLEPKFNRLVAFDDRLVHGVQLVEGSMDPLEGRFVLHGHIEESGPIVSGSLSPERLLPGLRSALERFEAQYAREVSRYDGPLVLRITISAEGRVRGTQVLVDRVFTEQEADHGWSAIKSGLVDLLASVAFPPSTGETTLTLPIRLGDHPPPGHAPGKPSQRSR